MKLCPRRALYTDGFVVLVLKTEFLIKQDDIVLSWTSLVSSFSAKEVVKSSSLLSACLDCGIEMFFAMALYIVMKASL
jgi:hypothetical protein